MSLDMHGYSMTLTLLLDFYLWYSYWRQTDLCCCLTLRCAERQQRGEWQKTGKGNSVTVEDHRVQLLESLSLEGFKSCADVAQWWPGQC